MPLLTSPASLQGSVQILVESRKCTGASGVYTGELMITGGTGKFEGISGGGPMLVRTALAETAASQSSGAVIRSTAGLAMWPELKYKIPSR